MELTPKAAPRATQQYTCPSCGTHYYNRRGILTWRLFRAGQRCGDLSQGHPDPCPGRLEHRVGARRWRALMPARNHEETP